MIELFKLGHRSGSSNSRTMLWKYLWSILPPMALYVILQRYDYYRATMLNVFGFEEAIDAEDSDRVFTVDELKKYTNLEDGVYLAILGLVFDVTKGSKHYGPDGSYHAFTGKDASLAFVRGDFKDEGLTDDVSSLSVQEMKQLDGWIQFYKENYLYRGKLKGRYFDEEGRPTDNYRRLEKIMTTEEDNSKELTRKKLFPPCNVEWNAESGTKVWCSSKSGGVEREWVGVPRIFYENPGSKKYRCACVRLDGAEYQENKAKFRRYEGCGKTLTSCAVQGNDV